MQVLSESKVTFCRSDCPGMVIHVFEQTHGIVIKVSNPAHPDSVEVIAYFTEVIDGALEKLEKNDFKSG